MPGRAAVADHQARPAVALARRTDLACAIAFQPVERQAMLAGTGDDGMLHARSGQFEDTASVPAPAERSARLMPARPCANPAQMRMCAGSAVTPRARAR